MNQPDIPNYNPGTVLTVGTHHVKVLSYLTSGGFAQVYSAEIQPADPFVESNVACLKRVIVPDKPSLNSLRAEVDAMKLLRNNKHVVSYIDSHAAKSSFPNGSYEVFLLMEYCAGGGLIDFMNTRLQNRLQEYEVLNIMSQVTQGIAAMHALQPPLIHRDIKIENVLISHTGQYKVCDFGSVSGAIRPPQNPQEFAYVQHDVLKNTTAQYRSPEMIDLYRGHSIDEKSDIWALGVFLYKLCYYTTPFEKGGELAILHSRFQFPAQPIYSDRLKGLIRRMLMEQPDQRPNVCQLLEEVSRMQGVQCPVRNFYLLKAMEQQQSVQNQLRFSRTQPILNVPIMGQPVSSPMHQLPGAPIIAGAPHLAPSNSLPVLASRPRSAGSNGAGTPFQTPSTRPFSAKATQHYEEPLSSSAESLRLSVSPVRHGRGDIAQIVRSNLTSSDRPTYVDSVTQTSDSEKAPSKVISTSSISLPSKEAYAAVNKKSLGRSSSLSAGNGGHKVGQKVSSRQQSMIPNARLRDVNDDKISSRDKSSEQVNQAELSLASVRSREAKESIQRRVRDLLNSSEDLSVSSSEPKVGKIQSKQPQPHQEERKTDKGKSKQKVKPRAPPKPAHLRPKPPPKPAFLSGKRTTGAGPSEAAKNAVIDAKVESLEKDRRKGVTGTL